MSRYHSYINTAKDILDLYNGQEPFASFLKKYFAGQKKFGSTDRRQISHICYCYFRIGKMCGHESMENRLLIGLFLCSTGSNEMLRQLRPDWDEQAQLSAKEKITLTGAGDTNKIFPFNGELSEGIVWEEFCLSHLKQPDLFLRLRPGKEKVVKQKLEKAAISFRSVSETCLSLLNASKVDAVIELNKEAVVQDLSSQRVGEYMRYAHDHLSAPISAWDCCAASGGKSIMLHDIDPAVDLTVSDIRESILVNLKKRFKEAGLSNYTALVADLTTSDIKLPAFQLINCDAPCSGSGTWGRGPEQLSYFEEKKVNDYASLQKRIVSNTISWLRPGGYYLYSTCSVFKKENEEVVEYVRQHFPLELIKMEIIKGYDAKADTMFAALLKKPL